MGRYAADKPCTSDLLINVCWGHRLPSPSSTSSAFFVFFFSLSFLQIDVKSVWGTCFTPTDGPLKRRGAKDRRKETIVCMFIRGILLAG